MESSDDFHCEFEHCDEQVFAREARAADEGGAFSERPFLEVVPRAAVLVEEALVEEALVEEAPVEEAPREETPHWVSLRVAAAEAQRVARKQRQREAYQRAKERRANDPRLQQLKLQQKEVAKARRREHYERVKQHRKAAKTAGKAVRSAERASAEGAERSFFAKGRVRTSKAALMRETRELAPESFAGAAAANDIR